jgi:hypothetical protein
MSRAPRLYSSPYLHCRHLMLITACRMSPLLFCTRATQFADEKESKRKWQPILKGL